MCSIIGYRGPRPAARVLVGGLRRMEYRGYDSVGVATGSGGRILVKKGVGRVDGVNDSLRLDALPGHAGIGHTRWATQGAPTGANAHPHASSGARVAIVHNGSITNFEALRGSLEARGHRFASETDSEVIANLLESELGGEGGAKGAVMRTVAALEGHYAFAALLDDGTIAAARRRAPLIVGVGDGEHYVSSDVLGFVEYTDDAIYVGDGNIVVIDGGGLAVYGADGAPAEARVTKVSRELAGIYKGDYAHYTLKEISEQPTSIIGAGGDERAIAAAARAIAGAKTVYVVGSGTSHNAAIVAKHLLSAHAGIRAEVIVASELPVHAHSLSGGVMLAISQSGESADMLEAARLASAAGVSVVSLVNHPSSSLARESAQVVRINCGPEIGVAATKSFTSQLAALHRITAELGGPRVDMAAVSRALAGALECDRRARGVAAGLRDMDDVYVLGRGVHYAIASEAALKLKELAYIHAEAMHGGELKHGPLALLDARSRVIVINPPGPTHEDALSDAAKIRARGARTIGIDTADAGEYDEWLRIPECEGWMYPLAEIVPAQLVAYYTALERDTDPDHPRNLAKSVTVR